MQSVIVNEFLKHLETTQKTMDVMANKIELAAQLCINSLNNRGKILIFGNGGSAADSQHIAAELVSRYKK